MILKNFLLILGSIFFQSLMCFSYKYSFLFYIFSEVFFSLIFFLNLFHMVSLLFMMMFFFFFLITLLSLFFLLEMNFFVNGYIMFLGLMGIIFFKQGVNSSFLFFLKEKFMSFSVFLYLINSEFLFLWILIFVMDYFDFSINLVSFFVGKKGIILFFLFFWVLYFLLFFKYLLEGNFMKFILVYFFYSQFMMFFSILIGIKYFIYCFFMDLFMFILLLISYLFFDSSVIVGSGNYIYLHIYIILSFLLSLPFFPTFYLEICFFIMFLFNSISFSFFLFNLFILFFLYLFFYFYLIVKVFYEMTSMKKLIIVNKVISSLQMALKNIFLLMFLFLLLVSCV